MPWLLADGIKYTPWIATDKATFEDYFKQYFEKIFGEKSVLFDKKKITSLAGIPSVPDGFIVSFETKSWSIVKVELSRHDPKTHVTTPINDFTAYIRNNNNRNRLIDDFNKLIEDNKILLTKVRNWLQETEIHEFLSKVVLGDPKIVIVIDAKTDRLREATYMFKPLIIEFKIFEREGVGIKVHAVEFEPISEQIPETKSILPITGASQPSKSTQERGQRYLSFYQELASRLKEKVPSAIAEPKPLAYCKIQSAIGGVHFEWLFGGNPRTRLGVELHFARTRAANLELIKEFEKYKADIEKVTGEKVVFQENWKSLSSRLYLEKKEGTMTEELKIWAVEKMALLYNLLQPKLEALK
jgi:hypothetical protein